MSLKYSLIFVLEFLLSTVALAQPKIEFKTSEYDIGTVKREETAGIDIPFTNSGNQPLILINVKGTGTPAIFYQREPVPPGETAYIHFRMPTNFVGSTRQSIFITTNVNKDAIELRIKLRVIENDFPPRRVTGIVLDNEENPVPGAKVSIEYSDRCVTTGGDGKFIIMAREKDLLKVVSLGYLPQNISAEATDIIVRIQENGNTMQDVPSPFAPPHHKVALPDVTLVTKEDIENAGKPEYDFRKNADRNIFVIFISASELPEFNSIDKEPV